MDWIQQLDSVLLARLQFAFTISFHIIFPAFTIGLASFLAVIEWRYLVTKKEIYKEIYLFWVKIFAVAFALGVVSGVTMSYQFGTNWSEFTYRAGNVIGPLLGYEVLTAFFLEASFLGVMLFGWGRVSKRMHFVATSIVAAGTLISAFWILAVNSWMQTPTGFDIDENGVLFATSWIEIIFNPSFIYMLLHMVTATFLTTSFVIGGVGAYYLLQGRFKEHAKIMLFMATLMAFIVAPSQLLIGDLQGLNTLKHQPIKVAAMEGIWENETGAGFRILALPDEESELNRFELLLPKATSLILTHSFDGEVKGLKNWPKDQRPPVAWVFWSFRTMLYIGILMIILGLWGAYLHLKGRLYTTPAYLKFCVLMSPTGFIALLAGWFVTEIGRQPYIIYGVLKTAESSSPILGAQVAGSLIAYMFVYTIAFLTGLFYITRHIRRGVDWQGGQPVGSHGVKIPAFWGLFTKTKEDIK